MSETKEYPCTVWWPNGTQCVAIAEPTGFVCAAHRQEQALLGQRWKDRRYIPSVQPELVERYAQETAR